MSYFVLPTNTLPQPHSYSPCQFDGESQNNCCEHGTAAGSLSRTPFTLLLLLMLASSTTLGVRSWTESLRNYCRTKLHSTRARYHAATLKLCTCSSSMSSSLLQCQLLFFTLVQSQYVDLPLMASDQCHDVTHVGRIHCDKIAFPFEGQA